MKFVALVSGGKDSMFNIMHCLANGHELAAIANLHPPVTASDEMDSFMYQTVGYHAVSLYDQCLGVPMYRAEIVGSSVVKSLEYTPSVEEDETEDLYRLLRMVVKSHDIEAVSVGAILSTYQRTRVESICQRIGLTCLSYLWNRSQAELLDEIIDSGVDARIVKTAGIGLSKKHLGMTLKELRSELFRLNKDFGLHLCGEGGEYETLVFDAPNMRKRLKLVSSKIMEDSDECVSYLSNLVVDVEEKDPSEVTTNVESLPIPPLLDEPHTELYNDIKEIPLGKDKRIESSSALPELQVMSTPERLFLANISSMADNLEDETRQIFSILRQQLQKENLTFDHLLSISLLVSDMSSFQQINKVYSEFFTKPNPPSRLCIQTNLQTRLQLSALATKKLDSRRGLHVQGRSYWAPANIGPYAQSIQSEEITTIAGQIGLVPSTLKLEPDVYKQTILSLQHADKIREAVNSEQWAYTVAFITSTQILPIVLNTWETGPLLIAVVKALPKGAQVEWTGQAINDLFIKGIPDEEEDDQEDKWVYPPKPIQNGKEYGRYGTKTITAKTVEELNTQMNTISKAKISSVTVYTTQAQQFLFNCEFVYVDHLYTKNGDSVPIGAVVTYRL